MTRWVLVVALLLAGVGSASAQLVIGSRVQVTLDAAVRDVPGGTSLGIQPIGAMGVIVAGPQSGVWGFTWLQVNYDTGADGWTTDDRLALALTLIPGKPAAPTITRRDVSSWTLAWTWSGGTPAATVGEIERGPSSSGPFAPLATTVAGATKHEDLTAVNGQAYCYRVRGRIGAAVSAFAGICTP